MAYVFQRWLARELRAAGATVVEVEGWENRGRPASTGAFNPQGAATTHHTGPWSSVSDMISLLIRGRSDLPGPLSQVATAPDGTIYVIAAGRANHAGKVGKSDVPGMPFGADGNALSIGNEVITNGTSPLPEAQRRAIAIFNKVVTSHYGRGPEWAHRHADISGTGKWDIGQLTTAQLRADVRGVDFTQEEDVDIAALIKDLVPAFWDHRLPSSSGTTRARIMLRQSADNAYLAKVTAEAALEQARAVRAGQLELAAELDGMIPGIAAAVKKAIGEEIKVNVTVTIPEPEEG